MTENNLLNTVASSFTLVALTAAAAYSSFIAFTNLVQSSRPADDVDFGDEALVLVAQSIPLALEQTGEFHHQVAGHIKQPIISLGNSVLKPLNKKLQFLRELRFYNLVNLLGGHWTQNPQRFVPRLTGWYRCNRSSVDTAAKKPLASDLIETISAEHQLYLGLEDLTAGSYRPCAMDIKMGRQTYEPDADPSKKRREVRKCPHQYEVGFRISGLQVYDVRSDTYGTVGKDFGRKLTPNVVHEALAAFFYDGTSIRRDLVLATIQELEKLLLWFRSQTDTHYYCSSLLITYDSWRGRRHMENHYTEGASHFLQRLGPQFPPPHPLETSHRMLEEPAGVSLDDTSAVVETAAAAAPPRVPLLETLKSSTDAAVARHPPVDPPILFRGGLRVKMIDFAHSLPGQQGLDFGYIHGLYNLISRLHAVLVDVDVEQHMLVRSTVWDAKVAGVRSARVC